MSFVKSKRSNVAERVYVAVNVTYYDTLNYSGDLFLALDGHAFVTLNARSLVTHFTRFKRVFGPKNDFKRAFVSSRIFRVTKNDETTSKIDPS